MPSCLPAWPWSWHSPHDWGLSCGSPFPGLSRLAPFGLSWQQLPTAAQSRAPHRPVTLLSALCHLSQLGPLSVRCISQSQAPKSARLPAADLAGACPDPLGLPCSVSSSLVVSCRHLSPCPSAFPKLFTARAFSPLGSCPHPVTARG